LRWRASTSIAVVDVHDELASRSHEVAMLAPTTIWRRNQPQSLPPESSAHSRRSERVGVCGMLRARPARRARWPGELCLACVHETSPCGEQPTKPLGSGVVPRAAVRCRRSAHRAGAAHRVRPLASWPLDARRSRTLTAMTSDRLSAEKQRMARFYSLTQSDNSCWG
jgi:hypothetical protein